MLLKTIVFAADKHKNQKRKDKIGTPYINHPLGVAHILCNEVGMNYDAVLLQAAILHDTIEDTDTNAEELESCFGKEVTNLVLEVTDNKSISKSERKALQVAKMKSKSRRAQFIKLADKLYNLRDLEKETPVGWTTERVVEYCRWAKQVTDEARGMNAELDKLLDKQYEVMEAVIKSRERL